jgi:type II secretory pathway component HofQ
LEIEMAIQVPFNSVADAVKKLGEKEAFSCLETGYKQKEYRKQQNMKNQAILEMAKKDPRFKDMVLKNEGKKTGTNG